MQYTVYIKIDDGNRIIEINSSAFISDLTGWIKIDSGEGDRYRHAQGNYLPDALTDENGRCRYKYENGVISERSTDEMEADLPADIPIQPTDHERLEALEAMFSEIGALSLLSNIKMSNFYVLQVKLGRISVNDVPLRWREAVRKELNI